MADEKLTPIVGPGGEPYYVTARTVIEAKHFNEAAKWTTRHHKVATRDHDEDGNHDSLKFARAVIGINIVRRDRTPAEYRVDWRSRVMGRYQQDESDLVTLTWLSAGHLRVKLKYPMPTPYAHQNMCRGVAGRTGLAVELYERPLLELTPISSTDFELSRTVSGLLTDGDMLFSLFA